MLRQWPYIHILFFTRNFFLYLSFPLPIFFYNLWRFYSLLPFSLFFKIDMVSYHFFIPTYNRKLTLTINVRTSTFYKYWNISEFEHNRCLNTKVYLKNKYWSGCQGNRITLEIINFRSNISFHHWYSQHADNALELNSSFPLCSLHYL